MPRIRTSSSTPETRRRELLISKSSSIDEKIQTALNDAKTVVRRSIEAEEEQQRASKISVPDSHASSSSSSVYYVRLASDDDGEGKAHFVSCFNIEPNYVFYSLSNRRRTSSLPSSTIIVDLLEQAKVESNGRSSSLNNLLSWQHHPQKVIFLYHRQYHNQPICPIDENRFLLANSQHIDVYQLNTGHCHEQIAFQSATVNYIALCYNSSQNHLLVASTSDLFVYDLEQRSVRYQLQLPGYPFHLDLNKQIRYLTCNSSSIYHGYFTFTSSCTSTIISRLSQFQFKLVCDLVFDDATLHGLHALESSVGIVIRYGRYSSKSIEEYSLYVYDSLLSQQQYRFDLNDVGCITGLTAFSATSDWILSDYQKKRLLFVNQESIEYVSFNEEVFQCVFFERAKIFAVWLSNRILCYSME